MGIGEKIKNLCERDNISLAELARRLGKTRPAIYEMVEKEDINTSILRDCSKIFNTPISYFFDENPENSLEDLTEKLKRMEREIESLRKENLFLKSNRPQKSKILLEIDLDDDELMSIKFKEKILKILNK